MCFLNVYRSLSILPKGAVFKCPHLMIQRNRVSFLMKKDRKNGIMQRKKEPSLTEEVLKMTELSLASVVLRLENNWPY